jgi:hypothetical protein
MYFRALDILRLSGLPNLLHSHIYCIISQNLVPDDCCYVSSTLFLNVKVVLYHGVYLTYDVC